MKEIELLRQLEQLVRTFGEDNYGCCRADCDYDMSHGTEHTDECEALLSQLDSLRGVEGES